MKSGRSVLALALLFSFALHAVALAALLSEWRKDPLDDIALSVELVIVSAPIDQPTDQPDPAPAAVGTRTPSAEPAPQTIEPPAQAAAPPPPAPTPSPAPVEPPKPVAKPEIAKPVLPKPVPTRTVEAPINLNPGFAAGEETQQAKAPSGGEVSPSFSVLHGPIPPYPAAARSRGQEGRVVLDVTIGIDGTPTNVALARSSGVALLDESAVTTVKTWRFRNDSARALTVTVPIVFELRSTAGR